MLTIKQRNYTTEDILYARSALQLHAYTLGELPHDPVCAHTFTGAMAIASLV